MVYPFDCIRENREFDNIPFVLLSEEFVDIYKLAFKKQIDDFISLQ
jgi:hypothetical protein